MKKSLSTIVSLLILTTILLGIGKGSVAQESGPVVSILGESDTESAPPNVRAFVSVVNPDTAQVISGLTADDFEVKESGQDVSSLTVTPETTGIAVVMVIDRGGIARQGDPRIGHAVDLADDLLNLLDIRSNNPQGDMVALIGIRGREEGARDITPLVDFQDEDRNIVSNEFPELRVEQVPEVTPLYDGLQEAIEMIIDNPDSTIREKLEHRRPVIVAFSDGIDNKFSDETIEMDIIDGCRDNNILLYTIRMDAPGRAVDADNMQRLAVRTSGRYMLHNDDTHDSVLEMFRNIVTQRETYRIEFPTHQPRGDYVMDVQVQTNIGTSDDVALFHSLLQKPEVSLTSPVDGAMYTVPYSHTPRIQVQMGIELTFPDDMARDPTMVRYYRNGDLIETREAPSSFDISWDATDYITQTEETRESQETKIESFTFIAEVHDAYLHELVVSAPVKVQVEWEPLPPYTQWEKILMWLRDNWWLLLILGALALGLVVLLIILIRTRGELARKVVARTTGILKGVTQRLGAGGSQRAPGKLVIVQGANMGREFRLATQIVKVGRDHQFCDFALFDNFTSNPHFSVQLEQTQFFITDEGSTNGTRLNSVPLQPHQRVLLQPDAIIEVGQTKIQFKRLGGATRQLGGMPPGAQPTPPPGQVPWHPPTQPAPPPGQPQGPQHPGPKQRGGPTKKVSPP